MDASEAKRIIEGLLFVFNHPLPLKRLLEVLPDFEAPKLREILQSLNSEYLSANRAFHVQEVAGGYQLVTDQELSPWIRRALQTPKPDSVSAAALETLAIIAYRQPITKAEMEAVRGVDVTASLETLIERKFVRVAGRRESPGRPFVYGTTPEFLRHFGLKSIDALPALQLPTIQEPDDTTAGSSPSPSLSPAATQSPDIAPAAAVADGG